MLHKIEGFIASCGYTPCFGAAGVQAYVAFQWPELQSIEALKKRVRDQNFSEHQRRSYL